MPIEKIPSGGTGRTSAPSSDEERELISSLSMQYDEALSDEIEWYVGKHTTPGMTEEQVALMRDTATYFAIWQDMRDDVVYEEAFSDGSEWSTKRMIEKSSEWLEANLGTYLAPLEGTARDAVTAILTGFREAMSEYVCEEE